MNAALFGTSDARAIATPALIQQMLDSGDGISDLVFSPGRPPQVERFGELATGADRRAADAAPEDTAGIARDLIRDNETVSAHLIDTGSTDLSYALPDRCRFRVNVFRQRGTFAIVMRMIAQKIPSIQELGLPPAIADCATLKNGIVLVTGPTGSGKSSTLAAIIDMINTEPRRSHPHHRGSDRVPAPAQEGHGPPARAAHRHADVRAGACAPRCARRRR